MWISRALSALVCLAVLTIVQAQPLPHKSAQYPSPYRTSTPTDQLVVVLKDGIDPDLFALSQGLEIVGPMHSVSNAYVVRASSVPEARSYRPTYGVIATYRNPLIRHVRHGFTPNDPFFFAGQPSSNWPGQWYLKNSDPNGFDIRVQGAWDRDLTGSGVLVGIIDDGFELSHQDFPSVYSGSNGYDFGQNDSNPSPASEDDVHGTAVAGIVGARGGNAIGITGAAPNAFLAGLRVDFATSTAANFADATLYRSSGANRNIKIKVHAYGVSDTFVDQSLERDALTTSTNAGTIHIFSAGNERGSMAEDCTKQMLTGSPNAIVVAGMGSDGFYSSYSSFGSSVICTAPAGSPGKLPLITTDRTGTTLGYNGDDPFPNATYTSLLTGTSAAAPMIGAVAALAKQAQPALNTRFFKHLLVKTSRVVDPANPGWTTNAAGNRFNANYGFGLIDANALTLALDDYASVSELSTEDEPLTSVGEEIPDNSSTGLTRTFGVSATTPLEEVLITLNVTHPFCGDLEAYLTSPRGTTSRLFVKGDDPATDISWTFCSNAFWGENPSGTWTLKLVDSSEFDVGTWNSFSATFRMGTLNGTDRVDSVSVSPSAVFGGSNSIGRVNLFGPARTGGVQVSLLSSTPAAAAVPSSIMIPAGASTATFTITTSIVPEVTNVTISATRLGLTKSNILTVRPPAPTGLSFQPSAVMGGSDATGTITLSAPAPSGGLVVSLSSSESVAIPPESVWVPAGSASADFSVTTLATSLRKNCAITATFGGLSKSAVLVVNRAILANLTLGQSTVTGGSSTTATITLDGPSPIAGANVLFASSNPAVIVPNVVTIPGSQTSKTFTVRTAPVAITTNIAITATRAGQTKSAVLIVARPLLASVTLGTEVVAGGQSTVGTATLNGPAPEGGMLLDLSSTSELATIAPTATVPAGQTSVNFTINTSPVTVSTSSIIRAALNGVIKGASLGIHPTTLDSIQLTPKPCVGGSVLSYTILLSSPAPSGGAIVNLISSHPGTVAMPSRVTIPAGTMSKTFTVVTTRPGVDITVTIRAACYGRVVSDNVLVAR